MGPEIDEASVNVEDLQAQIDLSMSYAANLASTWIQSKTPSNTSRRRELEKEIMEIAKRPPRLGVGASVSQLAQQSTREAARLKGQLLGKKRGREDTDLQATQKLDQDGGEEESRAGAIKKRVKVDPFDVSNKKKKKKQQPVLQTQPMVVVEPSPAMDKPSSSSHATNTPKGKAREDPKPAFHMPFEPNWNHDKTSRLSDEAKPPTTVKGQERKVQGETAKIQSPASAPKDDRSKAAYLALVASLSPKTKAAPEGLKVPLLNLSDHSDSEGNPPENASSTSPKKKRKRKKKKKHAIEGQNGTNTIAPISPRQETT